jgi:hypothetical protein
VKQQQILSWIENEKSRFVSDLVVVDDKTTFLNGFQRRFRFYEWTSMINAKLLPKSILAINNDSYDLETFRSGELKIFSDFAGYVFPKDFSDTQVLEITSHCSTSEAFLRSPQSCLKIHLYLVEDLTLLR